jgi:predicted methyltransferase
MRLAPAAMRALLAGALLLGAAPASLSAAPSDYAAVVTDPQRSADNRKLDDSRMPAEVLDFAAIKPGQSVADYQAGGGYYTELLSRVVGPKGTVYALTQPNFYKPEVWDPLLASHRNVRTMVAPAQALQLAPGSVDVIFAHLVFHDLWFESEKFQHPRLDVPKVLAGWFAAVKPGGHVIIADHWGPAGDTRALVDKLHRIDPATVKAAMAEAGFKLEAESDVLRRSKDDHTLNVFDPTIRGQTDRFLLRFLRP